MDHDQYRAIKIKRILNAGIPVMGHLGLTPQSIYKFGTYTVRAKEDKEAIKQYIRKIQGNFEPTDLEINDIDTEMNRERKFNTVSKLKHSLDSAQ